MMMMMMMMMMIIIIINAVGLELGVLSFVTHSLSHEPVRSIFYLGGLHLFLHGVDTVVQVLVSDCLPICLHFEANF
jgi:hypothetical protein